MNILIDTLPKTVYLNEEEYDINYDFRISMIFEMLMQDNTLNDDEKLEQALELYYPIIPDNRSEAIEGIIWFYKCGKEDETEGKGTGKSAQQIYNYNFDDEYIYSAFLDQYNIDLQDIEGLHWWKFKAMFRSLKEDNEIVKIMGYRAIDLNKIKDKEQKEYYRKLQKIHKIPVAKNEKEKLDEISNALMNGGDVSNLL